MTKYRKKPVVIEAIQWDGNNTWDVTNFMFGGINYSVSADGFFIHTLEGSMEISEGDYVIKGIKGEFYPCKPDVFEQTYEQVSE